MPNKISKKTEINNGLLPKLALSEKLEGGAAMHKDIYEDSSTAPTEQLPLKVEFQKKSIAPSKKKILGSSSYKNSKQKKKLKDKKSAEVKKVITKDRQIKVKIKHLQKELERMDKVSGKEFTTEKLIIEKKIAKLSITNQQFIKSNPKKS